MNARKPTQPEDDWVKDTRVFRLKSDAQLKRDVREELEWDTRVDARGIDVEVNNGVVTLAGSVPSYVAFVAAQKAAHRVAGVKDVANDLLVEVPEAQARTDTAIAEAVRQALAWDALVPEEQITSTVTHGWVTLEGSVESLHEHEDAGRAVRRLAGIKGVHNHIVVNPPKADAKDVSNAIQEALERCAKDEAEHITVKVSENTVTLSGTVSSPKERRAILETVGHAPGVKTINDQLCISDYMTPSDKSEGQ
jgi:hyperosmotically inducible protein